jgi:Type I restriction modification DNA specificity domain
MVRELCPGGLEQVPLGSIATQYVDRVRVQPDATYVNLGVKWYGEGAFAREPKAGKDIKGATLNRVRAGQFIYNRMFVTEGAFGLVTPDLADGVVSNEFPVYDLDPTRVLPEWLLLRFQDPSTVRAVAAEATGGTKSRRRWKEDQFEVFVIDLPPVPVQREIVRILCTFSELEAKLTAELDLRRLQYAYYRDRLLTFHDANGVRWIPLGELLREPLANGRSVPDGSGYPVLRLTALHGPVVDVSQRKLGAWDEETGRRFRIEAGDLLVVRGNGSKGLIARASMVEATEEVAFPDTVIRVRPNLDIISQQYLFHIWESRATRATIERAAKLTSGLWKVSQDDLSRVILPVPSVEEQLRIVSILDKFNSFVSDLSVGLPAELTARRKQYEYYRDRLLTFKAAA